MEKIFSLGFNPEDILCICTLPQFEGRQQRFLKFSDFQTEKWQRFLRAANVNGSNIYLSVFPLNQAQRNEASVIEELSWIFLDFDAPETYENFKKEYEPTITIQTSPGKFQCFLALSEPTPKQEVKAISRALSKQYGADNTFDLARVFRLPGFRNIKYPEKPLVSISETNPKTTYSSYNLPIFIEKASIPTPTPATPTPAPKTKTNSYQYSHFLERAPLKHSGEPDYSRADMAYAIYLFSRGFDGELISNMLTEISPNLKKRKGSGIKNYLNKT
jgi:hypothetical protein